MKLVESRVLVFELYFNFGVCLNDLCGFGYSGITVELILSCHIWMEFIVLVEMAFVLVGTINWFDLTCGL